MKHKGNGRYTGSRRRREIWRRANRRRSRNKKRKVSKLTLSERACAVRCSQRAHRIDSRAQGATYAATEACHPVPDTYTKYRPHAKPEIACSKYQRWNSHPSRKRRRKVGCKKTRERRGCRWMLWMSIECAASSGNQ